VIALVVTLLIAAVAVSGCSQATRHNVLTFFFTGVPEPGEEAADEARADAAVAAREERRRKKKAPKQAPFFTHGPYGAGQCERCHATAASKPFRTGKARVSDAAVAQAPSIGPRLAFPWEELCVTCHSEKSPAAAKANGLWQHEPAAKGRCTLCHSPHQSKRQYALLKENNVELCTQCHSINDLQITVQHKQDPTADCISCHNPHVGKSPSLLKAEYDEWQGFSAP
jgi:predicted CXXCH cytochrome family protein